MMISLNFKSGLFLIVLFYLSHNGSYGKSIVPTSGQSRLADLFEKLDLSSDPHHDSKNPSKSESSFSGGYSSKNKHKSHHGSDHSKDNEYDDKFSYKFSKHEDEGHETEYNVAHNCREFIHPKANSPQECIFRGGNPDDDHHPKGKKAEFKLNEEQEEILKGIKISRCRWDKEASLCLCPRSQEMCYDKKLKNKCYWHEEPKFSYDYDGYKVEEKSDGNCISNAERFYNVLHKLLIKRGKKDFAIRLNYNSIPAKSQLPYGPHGPSIIKYSSNSRVPSKYDKYFQLSDYSGEGNYQVGNGYNPLPYLTPYEGRQDYGQSLGGDYSSYGESQYVNSFQGYGGNQGYGEYNEPSYGGYQSYDYGNPGQTYNSYTNGQQSYGIPQETYSHSSGYEDSYQSIPDNTYGGSRSDYGHSSQYYSSYETPTQSGYEQPLLSYGESVYDQSYNHQPIYEQAASYSQPSYEQTSSYNIPSTYEQPQSYNQPTYEQSQSFSQSTYEQPQPYSQTTYELPQSYSQQSYDQPQSYNSQPTYEPTYEQSSNSHYINNSQSKYNVQNYPQQTTSYSQPSIPKGYLPPVYRMGY